jgi:hypothetical protein
MDLKPINRFINKVKQLSDSKQKDIRITIPEAIELTACITELLLTKFTEEKKSLPPTVNFDGGKLKR